MEGNEMQPVDFRDIVYAETVTSLDDARLNEVSQDKKGKGARKEFAKGLYASFMRTKVDGQEVEGIDLNNRDVAIEAISAEIQRVVDSKISELQMMGEVDEVDGGVQVDLPKGCVMARVTRLGMGFFTVAPAGGGRALQIEVSPKAARVELGTNVVVRPLQDKPLRDAHVRIPADFVRLA